MIRAMNMDTLEWECQEVERLPETAPVPRKQERGIPPDLIDADIDAFLCRMYALQQC